MRRLLIGLATAGAALGGVAGTARADVTTQLFTMPAGVAQPGEALAVGTDGTVYFGGDTFAPAPPIVRLDPAQAVPGTANGMTTVNPPDNAAVSGAATWRDFSYSAADKRLYWTRSDNTAGTLAGDTVATATLPVAPWGIAAAPGGGAYVAEYFEGGGPAYAGNRLAFLSSTLGLQEYANLALQTGAFVSARYDAKPRGVAVGASGTPWFTQADNGLPGYRVAKGPGGVYTEYDAAGGPSGSTANGALTSVAVDPAGAVWYLNTLKRTVSQLVEGGAHTTYPLSGIDPSLATMTPADLALGADGNLWLAVRGGSGGAIVRIAPSTKAATVYSLGASEPVGVAPDLAHGSVWFTTSNTSGSDLGRLTGFAPATTDAGTTDPGTSPPVTTPPITTPPVTGPPTPVTNTTLQPGTSTTTKVSPPRVKGDEITTNQVCVGPPQDKCSLVYLVQTNEYVAGFPGAKASVSAVKKKLTTIGKATVKLSGGQTRKVTIKLNAKGRKLRRAKSFKATLTVTQSVNGAKAKPLLKQSLKFRR
jgi:hypothetical protein